MMLLAQSSLSHGLSTVYRNLLSVSSETNEIYILPVPAAFVGKSFNELGVAVYRNRSAVNPVILIGAKTRNGIFVNPLPRQMSAFEPGDQVIVVALERPDSLVT